MHLASKRRCFTIGLLQSPCSLTSCRCFAAIIKHSCQIEVVVIGLLSPDKLPRDPLHFTRRILGNCPHTHTHTHTHTYIYIYIYIYMLGKYHNSLSSRYMRGVRINRSSDTQYLRGLAQTCLLHGLLRIFH